MFYTRYHPRLGHLLRSDKVGEHPAGLPPSNYPAHWTVDEHLAAARCERMFHAWACIRDESYSEWTAFAVIVDGQRVVIGARAVARTVCDLERQGEVT